MPKIYLLLLTCLCLTGAELAAQQNLIVPLHDGNVWIYAVDVHSEGRDMAGKPLETNSWGTETWTVAGDTIVNGLNVKRIYIETDIRGESHKRREELVYVDSMKMSRIELNSECVGKTTIQFDYINNSDSITFTDSLLCAYTDPYEAAFATHYNFKRVTDVKRGNIFDVSLDADLRLVNNIVFETASNESTTCAAGFGLLQMRTNFWHGGGTQGGYSSSRVLRGAIIDGKHYGDTDVTTDVPQNAVNDGQSYDGAHEIRVFPNPVNGPVSFKVRSTGTDVNIRLIDMLGRDLGVIANGRLEENQNVMFLNTILRNTQSGSYFAVLQVDGIARTHSLILVE